MSETGDAKKGPAEILAILRDQEEECDRLAGALYTKGLTTEQVSDIFGQIYGQSYSKASISRGSVPKIAPERIFFQPSQTPDDGAILCNFSLYIENLHTPHSSLHTSHSSLQTCPIAGSKFQLL